MRVIVVTPPAPLVTLEDTDLHLRLGGEPTEQAFVEGCIEAASGHIDGPMGWLGRSIGVQTLEARFAAFCDEPLRLPYAPVIDVVSVKYIDAAGDEQTVDTEAYELMGQMIEPAFSAAWPIPRRHGEAVRIRYRAGFVENPVADPLVAAIPAPIKTAVLLMVGDMFRFRETVAIGTWSEVPMSAPVTSLLSTYRAFF